jgi:hypothetical protein
MTFINEPEILTVAEMFKNGVDAGQVCRCKAEAFCVGDILACKTLGI